MIDWLFNLFNIQEKIRSNHSIGQWNGVWDIKCPKHDTQLYRKWLKIIIICFKLFRAKNIYTSIVVHIETFNIIIIVYIFCYL